MFVFYSSDYCIEYRPWLAYLLFPAIVIGAFVMAVEGPIPEPRSMLFSFFFDISGLVILLYMTGTFFVLWTFGKAVCSKVGNILYLIALSGIVVLGSSIIALFGEDAIWLLTWLVHCLAGMFLVFCPLNSVDCFIFVPPFRSFSFNGLWSVVVWLIIDVLFCLALGWTVAAIIHPLSLIFGILLASLLLKIPFVGDGIGDITLWQWIKGENSDEDLAWKDSWSVKRQDKKHQQEQEQQRDESLREKEKEFVNTADIDEAEETTSVLCQCGQIIHASIKLEGKTMKCTACSHLVHVPKLG